MGDRLIVGRGGGAGDGRRPGLGRERDVEGDRENARHGLDVDGGDAGKRRLPGRQKGAKKQDGEDEAPASKGTHARDHRQKSRSMAGSTFPGKVYHPLPWRAE